MFNFFSQKPKVSIKGREGPIAYKHKNKALLIDSERVMPDGAFEVYIYDKLFWEKPNCYEVTPEEKKIIIEHIQAKMAKLGILVRFK